MTSEQSNLDPDFDTEDEELSAEDRAQRDTEDELTELRAKIQGDIDKRQDWELRQTTWYTMVHDGLRRRNKPWEHAADLHFPLIDGVIDKQKPFYFNQLFGTETIAQFIPRKPELQPLAEQIAARYDWTLKQKSNLEEELLIVIDQMLTAGHGLCAPRWNTRTKQIEFDAIDPLHCIVPEWTKGIQGADRVTIVRHYSREQYMRDPDFTEKDEEFVDTICGSTSTDAGETTLRWTKDIREGITGSANADLIIVWEVWEQIGEADDQGGDEQDAAASAMDSAPDADPDTAKWLVRWMSPVKPETPLRPSIKNPFTFGGCPLVRFDREIKEKGHYASRGIPEKLAPFETALCAMWDEKKDFMSLCCRPLFTSDTPIPNPGNIRFTPGSYVGANFRSVQMSAPPVSFDQEMQSTRAVAEQLIGMPDNGLTEMSEGGPNDARTATEIKQVSGLAEAQTDINGRIFRLRLAELLRIAWSMLCQFDKDTQFFVRTEEGEYKAEELKLGDATLDPEDWRLIPNGSSDTWNKQLQIQKAMMLKQALSKSPWIDQPELDKIIVELVEPSYVRRIFQDPNLKGQSDYQDELKLVPALMLGIMLQVLPENDQQMRIKALIDFVSGASKMQTPISRPALAALATRMQQHIQSLQAVDPKSAHQAIAAWQQTLKQFPPTLVPQGAQPNSQEPPEKPKPLAESVQWGPDDFTPSERAQVLGEINIKAAPMEELVQWNAHKAQMTLMQKSGEENAKAVGQSHVAQVKAEAEAANREESAA